MKFDVNIHAQVTFSMEVEVGGWMGHQIEVGFLPTIRVVGFFLKKQKTTWLSHNLKHVIVIENMMIKVP